MSKPPSTASAPRVLLGTITTAHGIRGEVVLRTYTAEPDAICAYGPLSDADGKATYKITSLRVTPKAVIARIAGVNDRNAAEALRGKDLFVERSRLPPPGDDAFYHNDLKGLQARDSEGRVLGSVVEVANFGAGDLLEVRFEGAASTQFVPFTRACVPHIDVAGGFAVIVMPEYVGEPEPAANVDGIDDSTDDGEIGGD